MQVSRGRTEIRKARIREGRDLGRAARRAVGMAAIVWIAAGACARQRPIRSLQMDARMMQMAGEAVARRTEKKELESAKPGSSEAASVRQETRRPVVRIVVSLPDRRLALVEDDCVVKVYPVAVGAAATPSPEGEFRIVSRLENPAWYWPGKMVPAGAANPLGPRWMGLGVRGFGIHGTNEPRSIGRNSSHGCIRMRNRDVRDLFQRVRVGDVVELHGERDATVAMIFGAPQDGAGAGARVESTSAGRALGGNLMTVAAERMGRE